MSQTHEAMLTIENELGLHARAATQLVQLAAGYESRVQLEKDGRVVNGKSILGVLTLVAGMGARIRVITEGPDAEEALAAIAELVASKFGEER
jgi:phosphocarrier protein